MQLNTEPLLGRNNKLRAVQIDVLVAQPLWVLKGQN